MWKREMCPVTIRYRIRKITSSHYLTVWAQFSCNLDESKTDRKEILSFLRLCRSDYRFFKKITCDCSLSADTYFLKTHILDPGAQHIAPIKKCSKELRKPRKYAKWWRKRFSSKVIFIPGGPKKIFFQRSLRSHRDTGLHQHFGILFLCLMTPGDAKLYTDIVRIEFTRL